MTAAVTIQDIQAQIEELLKASPRLFLSWEFCLDEVERVCGTRISRGHIKNLANHKDTFRAGKNAGAPLPRKAPVEAASFYRWLFGKGGKNKN